MKCSACGAIDRVVAVSGVESYRENSTWGKCGNCKSYVLQMENGVLRNEVDYFNSRPWGNPLTAKRLLDFKEKLYCQILDVVRSHVPPPANLLDVGCCYGGFMKKARTNGYDTYGYDVLPDSVDSVRKLGMKCELAASFCDFRKMYSADREDWGVITCIDVHYYWPD